MTSAHLTSNSMLCDNTFLCPRRLFSSPISSWLCSPQPREATKLSLFHSQVNFSFKIGLAKYNFWLSLRSHYTSQERACKCTFDFHSQVNFTFKIVLAKCDFWLSLRSHFTSQERACKCTFDFNSEVTSPLKNVLASALLTFTHKSLYCDLHPIREGLPVARVSLWRSHPVLASLILPSGTTHPAVQEVHCGLGFALFVAQ